MKSGRVEPGNEANSTVERKPGAMFRDVRIIYCRTVINRNNLMLRQLTRTVEEFLKPTVQDDIMPVQAQTHTPNY